MKVFVSYRRADSRAITERLHDRLVTAFGRACVFKDVGSIAVGEEVTRVIKTALQQSAALLVMIGESWVTIQTPAGVRRLEAPEDWVRFEIEEALALGVPVIPVLIEGTPMPRVEELPPALAPLAVRQATLLRGDPDFDGDVQRLLEVIERAAAKVTPVSAEPLDAVIEGRRPLKTSAVLDRRLATELLVLFSPGRAPGPSDARLCRALEYGIATYDQLLVENAFGSTLSHMMSHEADTVRPWLCVLRRPPRDARDQDLSSMIADAADVWADDPRLQLQVARYDRSKGATVAAVEDNVTYLHHVLQLARHHDAAVLPHPDRWPLFEWMFAHSLWSAASGPLPTATVALPPDPTAASADLPLERKERARRFTARVRGNADQPFSLVRFGPMPHPFPPNLLRNFERSDLAATPSFLYEFCVPAGLSSRAAWVDAP